MIAWINGNVDTTDVILFAAVAAYVVERFVDGNGWSRTSRTLRSENIDLVRRNGELERKVERLEARDVEKAAQIVSLERHVAELKERDQLAVIQRLDSHEMHAAERHSALFGVLQDISLTLKGGTP